MFRKCTVLAYSAPPVEIVPGLRDLVDTTMSDSQGRFLGHGRRGAQLATQQGQRTTDTVRLSLQQVRETQNPSSFNLNLAAKLEMESQEGKEDQCSDDVSYASEVTMVTSNKSKTDSRKEIREYLRFILLTFEQGMKQGTKILIDLMHNEKEVAEFLESDKKEALFLHQHVKEVKKSLEDARRTFLLTKEALEFIESRVVACYQQGMKTLIDQIKKFCKEDQLQQEKCKEALLAMQLQPTMQGELQHCEHQPTDVAAFSNLHTPRGRRAQASDADSADSGLPGVGRSLLAKGWSDAQQRYFESLGKQNTGERWLTAIIQKLWEVSGGYHRERILKRRFYGANRHGSAKRKAIIITPASKQTKNKQTTTTTKQQKQKQQ